MFRDSALSLIDDYAEQKVWRSWPEILNCLPNLHDQLVLDLGCGIGDLASELSIRGANVIGVDANLDLINFARRRGLKNVEFRVADLKSFFEPNLMVDGIWSSFVPAYFPKFLETLCFWERHIRPGGWIALTEIDDLFGHLPLSERSQALLSRYVDESFSSERYDFRMGHRLADFLVHSNFSIVKTFTVADDELSFAGPARPQVVAAWRRRFDRMKLLQEFCGPEFESVRDVFLSCLIREDHRCTATVQCCIATKKKD